MFPTESLVLIVDDSDTLRSAIKTELEFLGYTNIIEASDGREAFAKLQRAEEAAVPVKLVISDWNMPHMTGLEFLKKVRAVNTWKNLPFILLTSESEISQVTTAVTAGVSSYIVKPVVGGVLEKKLEAVWKRHHSGK